ncbi:hypothetical protein SR39_01515 [Methylobacterium radiotolerans]|uniref:Uncharacterized protein n=2 Tax=Methylobacterium radiotolerans TaxID=31998 RepID=B1LS31_METRJ|nr:hypothetical protein Mrad2831_0253 [Methylobacterium radiotolerans JCM 2831]KIU37204.1 hypothetical protein SR39_01515 [Methylobacterium radiotolerans]MBN6818153.1 hypothetical protein [Methylobacterium organophilum]RUP22248.1 MAG: hypothetical protein EKK44_05925 [Methylobacterium sp.]GAN46362.1 hypothetical protein ME121_0365 [Methylobacterium sp. ME121]
MPQHLGGESLSLHQGHTANTVADLMETSMTRVARFTLAAAAAAATVAVLAGTYVEILDRALPMHFV